MKNFIKDTSLRIYKVEYKKTDDTGPKDIFLCL